MRAPRREPAPRAAPDRTGHTGRAALLLLALAGLPAGCRPGSPQPPPRHLLLVTLDTTRSDRVGAYGAPDARTPCLDRLARKGILARDALTACPLTLPSHASLLTGRTPPEHGVRDNALDRLPDPQTTLAEALSERGFRCAAVVGSFVLDHRFGLDQGFRLYDDLIPAGAGHLLADPPARGAAQVTGAALRALDDLLDGAPPHPRIFLWAHYFDPHAPYDPPEPYAALAGGRPYEGEIAFMDRELGRLLAGLGRRGLLGSTLVAVLGDHGEGLSDPHRERTHGMLLYQETLRIPLILGWPGAPRGAILQGTARTVDVFPTLLEILGIPLPNGLSGSSLVPALRRQGAGRRGRPAYAETLAPFDEFGWAPIRALRLGRWKWIDAPHPELYDLAADPLESTNLAAARPGVAARLRGLLDAAAPPPPTGPGRPAFPPPLGPSERARLGALGYLASPRTNPPVQEGSGPSTAGLPNPKEMIELRPRLYQGFARLHGTDPAGGARILEGVLERDPGNRMALRELGFHHLASGRPRIAEPLLARLSELEEGRNPDTEVALGKARLEIGLQGVDAGRPGEAAPWLEGAARSLARAAGALGDLPGLVVARAEALVALAREDEAARVLEEGARRMPRRPELRALLDRLLGPGARDGAGPSLPPPGR